MIAPDHPLDPLKTLKGDIHAKSLAFLHNGTCGWLDQARWLRTMFTTTLLGFISRLPIVGLAAIFVAGMVAATLAQQVQTAPSATSPSVPVRTEIATYDNWTVTCRDDHRREKRACSAELNVAQDASGERRVVLSWVVGVGAQGALTTVLRFPSGVFIVPGVEIKVQGKSSRKLPITDCEPNYCAATATMEDAFLKDLVATQHVEAVIQTSDRRKATFTINMKGFSEALEALRKK